MVEWCRQLVESNRFQVFILAMIMLSAILLGLETDKTLTTRFPFIFDYTGSIIVAVFTIEIVLKLIANVPRPWRFFYSAWNIFDFVIVIACFLPSLGSMTAILRLFRVLRAMRVVNVVPELRVIVTAMIKALPSVSYVALLLFLHFYVYAVLGVFLWGKNDPGHFGTLPLAFLTLFRVLTQEDWTDVMYTQMWGRDLYPPQGWDQSGTNEGNPVLGALFFVSFIMIGGMVILNLFVGVIIGTMTDVQKEEAERLKETKRAAAEARHAETRQASLSADAATGRADAAASKAAEVEEQVAEIDRQLELVQSQLKRLRSMVS